MNKRLLRNTVRTVLLVVCFGIMLTSSVFAKTKYLKCSYGEGFWNLYKYGKKSKTIKVDLNKDGRKEKVTFKKARTTFGESWVIYINNKKALAHIQQFVLVDMNNRDRYIELIARRFSKQKSEYVLHDCFYRYNGKKLYQISKNKVNYNGGAYSPRNLWGLKANFPGNGTIVDEILVYVTGINDNGASIMDVRAVIKVPFRIKGKKLRGDFYRTFTTDKEVREKAKQKWGENDRDIYQNTGLTGNRVAFRITQGTSFIIEKIKIEKEYSWFYIATADGYHGWYPVRTSSLTFANRNGWDYIY